MGIALDIGYVSNDISSVRQPTGMLGAQYLSLSLDAARSLLQRSMAMPYVPGFLYLINFFSSRSTSRQELA